MTVIWIVGLLLVAIVAGLVGFSFHTARKVERAFPPSGRFMEIGGQRIHYVDKGQGPAIVMIHGLGGNLMNYSYALGDRLARDHRVIMVDRPGSGHSVRPKSAPANLAAQADTIAVLIRNLALDRPVLVGHSLGGALALTLAANHPDCVGAMALIAPLTEARDVVPPVFKGLAIAWPLMRTLVSWTIALPMSMASRDRVLETVFGPDPVPDDFGTRGGGLLGLRPNAYYHTSSDMLAVGETLPATMATYPSISYPIGMLYGRDDRLLHFQIDGEGMKAKCPQLDLRLIEGGHMLPLTKPDACETLIRDIAARRYAAAAA